MDRKTLLADVGDKLRKARKPLKYSENEMADRLDAYRTSYYRYERGETSPQLRVLYALAKAFDISLDWLIADKGPMYYKEKQVKEKPESATDASQTTHEDIKELIEHMEQIPLLRYEVLVMFHKFKEDRKEIVETAMKNKMEK